MALHQSLYSVLKINQSLNGEHTMYFALLHGERYGGTSPFERITVKFTQVKMAAIGTRCCFQVTAFVDTRVPFYQTNPPRIWIYAIEEEGYNSAHVLFLWSSWKVDQSGVHPLRLEASARQVWLPSAVRSIRLRCERAVQYHSFDSTLNINSHPRHYTRRLSLYLITSF